MKTMADTEASICDLANDGAFNYVQLGELRFHYVSWGPKDALGPLCLHGLRSYVQTFQS